jgi:hypothetical protein
MFAIQISYKMDLTKLNKEIAKIVDKRNNTGLDQFDGYAPAQVHAMCGVGNTTFRGAYLEIDVKTTIGNVLVTG